MTFHQQLVLTIVDKLIIGGVIAVLGYLFKRSLDNRSAEVQEALQFLKGQQDGLLAAFNAQKNLDLQVRKEQQENNLELRREQQTLQQEVRDFQKQKDLQASAQIAAARLPAYQKFWAMTEKSAKSLVPEFSPEQRKELERDLRATYFRDGNAIMLTPQGVQWYQTIMERLKLPESTPEQIHEAFTGFRRQLKLDVKVYTEEQAAQPTDPKPLESPSSEAL